VTLLSIYALISVGLLFVVLPQLCACTQPLFSVHSGSRLCHSPLPHSQPQQQHAAAERRGQASHPPRVLSSQHGSFLCRTRCSPQHRGRARRGAPLAQQMGRHTAVTAAQGSERQTTRAQHAAGAPSHCSAHPQQQPCASRCALHEAAAAGAARLGRSAVSANIAALRQGGSRRATHTWQEEKSRGV
jgi:hypothetical protein